MCFSPHKQQQHQQQPPPQQRLSVSSDMMPYRNDHHSNGYASGTHGNNWEFLSWEMQKRKFHFI
jgi:hypothetical protein